MAEKHLTDGTTALTAQPRVIKIDLLDEAAVAGITGIRHDHAIVRSLLGAHSSQTNLNHDVFPPE